MAKGKGRKLGGGLKKGKKGGVIVSQFERRIKGGKKRWQEKMDCHPKQEKVEKGQK